MTGLRSVHPRIGVAAAVIAAALGYLIFTGFQASASYYLTLRELPAPAQLAGKSLRLAGEVRPESVDWQAEDLTLRFQLVDGPRSLPVVYRGTVPDTFARTLHVVVEGEIGPDGVFQARNLFVQCPSKYEALYDSRGG